jgi:flavin-dependent dehydrogenase
VVVAGGGLAGAAACLTLGERGVPVRWIAPRSPALDKPGESLSAAAEPLLRALGLDGLLGDPAHRRVESTVTSWGSAALRERSRMGHPGGLGHVVDRARFECAATSRATDHAAVAVIEGAVASIGRGREGWVVETDRGERIVASMLVDATGRAAAIGRQCASLHRDDRLTAAYAFLEQIDEDVDPTPTTLVEAVGNGWWYATVLTDRRLVVNLYSDPDLMPRRLARDEAAWRALVAETRYVSRWIETGGFALAGPPRVASAGTTWLSRPAGRGWVAVGDAAAAFDPLSSHGMTTALWTGIEAGKAVHRTLNGADEALPDYADRVLQGVGRYRADRRRIYACEPRFARHPFWQRRHGPGAADDASRQSETGKEEAPSI